MYIVKVLKRRDAASVLVAIMLAFTTFSALPALTGNLAGMLSGAEDGTYIGYAFPGSNFQSAYVQPVVSMILQVILIELGLRVLIFARGKLVRRSR